jgi:hypothetical protein
MCFIVGVIKVYDALFVANSTLFVSIKLLDLVINFDLPSQFRIDPLCLIPTLPL